MAFIYVITNDVNGKQYVGKTNFSLERRFKEHILDSKKERCNKRPLYSAMNKYGVEHFHIEQLEECSADYSAEREEYWITKLNTYGHTGYNATRGGDSKKYYDYQEIANMYLKLQNQKKTARYFGCDVSTVKIACEECNVSILSSQDLVRQKYSKRILMLPDNIIFNSIAEAAKYLKENKYTQAKNICGITVHIRSVAKTNTVAYQKHWKFI